jgi:hypothetical protein
MLMKHAPLVTALALAGYASSASAQGAWSSPPPTSSSYPSRPVEQYDPPSAAKQQAMHRGYQGAFNLGIPIWLDADRDVVRPGADLNFFGAYDMGYVAFGLGLGAMWTPINFYNIPGIGTGYERKPMTRLYLAPELRVQIPNNTPMLPYIGITFDANWWRVNETNIVCGGTYYYYCARIAVFRFTPGMTAKFGLALKVGSGSYLDIGFKYSLSGTGSFFFRREQWITPYFGVLFR